MPRRIRAGNIASGLTDVSPNMLAIRGELVKGIHKIKTSHVTQLALSVRDVARPSHFIIDPLEAMI
jgi:hypothetical protein